MAMAPPGINPESATTTEKWSTGIPVTAAAIWASTEAAPWYVVPADDKKNARLIISRIILDTFNSLDMRYPTTDAKRKQELLAIREQLVKEGKRGD